MLSRENEEKISLIKSYIKESNFSKAEELALSDISELNNSFELNFLLGQVYRNKNEYNKSLNYYNNAIKINPNISYIYTNIANLYREINDYNNAFKYYKKSLILDSENIGSLINFSILLKDIQNVNEAIKNLKKVLELEPNNLSALINISLCYSQKGENKKAGDYINKAYSIDSSNYLILNCLANNKKYLGKPYDAIKYYKLAKEILLEKIKDNNEKSLLKDLNDIRKNLGSILKMVGYTRDGINEIKKSSGYITMKIDSSLESKPLRKSNNYDFIGSWEMNNPEFCSNLIEIFEKNKSKQRIGEMGSGIYLDKKNSIDISIDPNNFRNSEFSILNNFFPFLNSCLEDYCKTWPFLNKFGDLYIGEFNIQKYKTGGHFLMPHAERMDLFANTRLFAWMTYLNDVEGGGETVFTHYDKSFKPKEGKTLIWPGEWTHAHYGSEVTKGNKYIITGWMEMHR